MQQRDAAAPPESFNGSALEWVLRKADESLDEIEENPPEYAKVLYDISTGPIGAPFCLGFIVFFVCCVSLCVCCVSLCCMTAPRGAPAPWLLADVRWVCGLPVA